VDRSQKGETGRRSVGADPGTHSGRRPSDWGKAPSAPSPGR